jgi:hypothetical protein
VFFISGIVSDVTVSQKPWVDPGYLWLMPVILPTQEAEIRRIMV